ncbi:MAG: anthranilate synthase component I family protein [Phycisphaerales bacterium JB040]
MRPHPLLLGRLLRRRFLRGLLGDRLLGGLLRGLLLGRLLRHRDRTSLVGRWEWVARPRLGPVCWDRPPNDSSTRGGDSRWVPGPGRAAHESPCPRKHRHGPPLPSPIEPTRPITTPASAIAGWPPSRPLAALWRTGHATPTRLFEPTESRSLDSPDGLDTLTTTGAASPHRGWVLALSYDLGRTLEPAAGVRALPPSPWPRILAQRVEGCLAYDHDTHAWSAHDDAPTLPTHRHAPEPAFHALTPLSATGRDAYTRAVTRVLEYIRAGDVYQANIGHRLTARCDGSARALMAALAHAADPWHGAYLEHDPDPATRLAWCSASPELLLDYHAPTRTALTRPMKGTQAIAQDRAALERSAKERAELAMIVDLMRNDLGRVAEFGTVRVETPRTLESHAGSIRHATATVRARVRQGVPVSELVRSVFPAGSVTGAPKIRAMQIIDELEGHPRGPWCGSIGFLADDGSLTLNVAIRTALLAGTPDPARRDGLADAELTHWVGAGIVADSDPDREWDETLLKAEPFLRALRAARAAPVPEAAP